MAYMSELSRPDKCAKSLCAWILKLIEVTLNVLNVERKKSPYSGTEVKRNDNVGYIKRSDDPPPSILGVRFWGSPGSLYA